MSDCRFSVPLNASPEHTLTRAKATIAQAGGKLEGNAAEGTFTIPMMFGKIAGSYTITDGGMDLVITDKPLIVSCAMIEEQLRRRLLT